ncbi:MAG: hypothetical protein U0892_16325 [Pirellulales bacterium]
MAKRKTTGKRNSKVPPAPLPETNLAADLLYGSADQVFRLVNRRTNAVERVIDRVEMEAEFRLRHEELKEQRAVAAKALKRLAKWVEKGYFGSEVSCSIAFRKKFGRIISPLRYVLEVHVPFKSTDARLIPWPDGGAKRKPSKGRIYAVPQTVDGVLTKVIETQVYRTDDPGAVHSDAELPGTVRVAATGRLGDIGGTPAVLLSSTELIGGLPTSQADHGDWGTVGIVCQSKTDGKHLALVNSHFGIGSMVQPPRKPAPADQPLWEIGSVVESNRVDANVYDSSVEESFYVDGAYFALKANRHSLVDLVQEFAAEPFLYARSYLRDYHDDSNRQDSFRKVFKFGAKTLTRIEGFIENTADTVPYQGRYLRNVIRARRNGSGTFTLDGDSGSVLVAPIYDSQTQRERFLVVGLCFGGVVGNNEVLYACQFAAVIKALKLPIPAASLRDDWEYSRQ